MPGEVVPFDPPDVLALATDADAPFTDELLDLIDAGIESPNGVTLATVDGAEYTMRRLNRIEAELDAYRGQYDGWRERLDEWLVLCTAGLVRRKMFLTELLEAWAVAQRRADPDGTKSFLLPSGVVETRMGKEPTVVVADEDALLAWAADNLDEAQYEAVVKTEQSVRISELRKLVHIADLAVADEPVYGVFLDDVRVAGVEVVLPEVKPMVRPNV